MRTAAISGPAATPKGLRHAFGVAAFQTVPPHIVQRWLGHASLRTTAIYGDVSARLSICASRPSIKNIQSKTKPMRSGRMPRAEAFKLSAPMPTRRAPFSIAAAAGLTICTVLVDVLERFGVKHTFSA